MIRVSTIIPVYNGARTIARSIDGALGQDYKHQEIIVIDDGSNDETAEIIKRYGERIVSIRQPNRGRAIARNAGLDIAKGEFIAFLDADDEWLSHKLTAQIRILEQNPECVLVYSDAIGVDESGEVFRDTMQPSDYAHAPSLQELRNNGIWPSITSSWVMRRKSIDACGRFVESFGHHWGGEDSLLFFRARELGSFGYVPECLLRFRVSTTLEHLRKRLHGVDRSLSARERLRQFFVGEDHYLELIQRHYGPNDSTEAVGRLRYQKQPLLLSLALLALYEGDRALARQAYLSLLSDAPLRLRTYLRFLWTFLPSKTSRYLLRPLPVRYRQALMGPPRNNKDWWT
jgi:glycosyltransferase involved in cell wall biosynthesis